VPVPVQISNGAGQALGFHAAPAPAVSERALNDLRSELRVVVDRMASQQATLVEWRAAIDAEVAQAAKLATVPERLAVVAQEMASRHAQLAQHLVESLEAQGHAMVQERAAHAQALDTALASMSRAMFEQWSRAQVSFAQLLQPLVEGWSEARVGLARLGVQVDSFPGVVTGALVEVVEAQTHEQSGRLEEGQQQGLASIEASLAVGMSQLESNVSQMLKSLVAESLAAERSTHVAEFEKATDKMTRRLSAAQKQAAASAVDSGAIDERLTEMLTELEALRKLARSIDRKTPGPPAKKAPARRTAR